MRSLRTVLLVAVAGALAVALAACGSSSSSSSNASAGSSPVPNGVKSPVTESLTGGKRGGVLTDLQSEDFEHLDPGQAYFQLDYQITNATQRSLYSYKPNTFSESTPDLAEGPAKLSDGIGDILHRDKRHRLKAGTALQVAGMDIVVVARRIGQRPLGISEIAVG